MSKTALNIWRWWLVFLAASLAGFFFLKTVDPQEARLWQLTVFYLIVFLWVFSLGSMLNLLIGLKNPGRQGVLLGLLAVVILILQSFSMLTLINAALVGLIFLLLEFYAVSR